MPLRLLRAIPRWASDPVRQQPVVPGDPSLRVQHQLSVLLALALLASPVVVLVEHLFATMVAVHIILLVASFEQDAKGDEQEEERQEK